jgi:hypothetical protein
MKAKSFISVFLVAPFVMAQLILAPVAAGALMLRGILLNTPGKKAVPKYGMTTKLALISNKS